MVKGVTKLGTVGTEARSVDTTKDTHSCDYNLELNVPIKTAVRDGNDATPKANFIPIEKKDVKSQEADTRLAEEAPTEKSKVDKLTVAQPSLSGVEGGVPEIAAAVEECTAKDRVIYDIAKNLNKRPAPKNKLNSQEDGPCLLSSKSTLTEGSEADLSVDAFPHDSRFEDNRRSRSYPKTIFTINEFEAIENLISEKEKEIANINRQVMAHQMLIQSAPEDAKIDIYRAISRDVTFKAEIEAQKSELELKKIELQRMCVESQIDCLSAYADKDIGKETWIGIMTASESGGFWNVIADKITCWMS